MIEYKTNADNIIYQIKKGNKKISIRKLYRIHKGLI